MEDRKKEHLQLAFASRIDARDADTGFDYEPLLSAHPIGELQPFAFAGKSMRLPVWVSSLTGGSERSGVINRRLAAVCGEFGMGMGLGSCRILLDDERFLPDFDVRTFMGDEVPLYANLGICQLEKMLQSQRFSEIEQLVTLLRADGVIIHINPLQEAFQPEGDRLELAPVDILDEFLKQTTLRVIVKEVGQGMGPASLRRLLQMPIQAIEFGALGGTNFSRLEMLRDGDVLREIFDSFAHVGHSPDEMLACVNGLIVDNAATRFPELIISGGITSPLHGYRLVRTSVLPAVYGMGARFLKFADQGEAPLRDFVSALQKSWMLADAFLKVR